MRHIPEVASTHPTRRSAMLQNDQSETMRTITRALVATGLLLVAASALYAQPGGDQGKLLRGKSAFGDWHQDAPGVRRLITPNDLPPPGNESTSQATAVISKQAACRRPSSITPPGFTTGPATSCSRPMDHGSSLPWVQGRM